MLVRTARPTRLLQRPEPVDVLATPAAAPWMKISEAVEYLRAVAPARAVPIHQGEQYWLVATPAAGDTWDAWNAALTSGTGPSLSNENGTGWVISNPTQGAFDVEDNVLITGPSGPFFVPSDVKIDAGHNSQIFTDSGNWPAVIAEPLRLSVPTVGSESIWTESGLFGGLSSGSRKPKSATWTV